MVIVCGNNMGDIFRRNALNLGLIAGLMFDAGKGDIFLGLLTPHGLIELTAVFLAAAAGMRLGWSVVSPGNRPRGQVLAEQGRAVVAVAVGLGKSNAEISRELYMSVATVKAHVSRVLEKLELNNRVQIALLAHDAGEA